MDQQRRSSSSSGNLPATRGGGYNQGLSRSGDWDPWNPGSFLSMSPFQMMRRMQEDMDRIFSQFFTGGGSESMGSSASGGGMQPMGMFQPRVDVSEDDREYCIEVDLPGIPEDQIDVQVFDHTLRLRAEMRQEQDQPQGASSGATAGGGQQGMTSSSGPQQMQQQQRQYLRRERRYGYFERTLSLPENVDEDNIRAEFNNGVLLLHLPKTQQMSSQARRIAIGSTGSSSSGSLQGSGTAMSSSQGMASSQQMPSGSGTTSGSMSSGREASPDALNDEERMERDMTQQQGSSGGASSSGTMTSGGMN